jgi:hypothetical protein
MEIRLISIVKKAISTRQRRKAPKGCSKPPGAFLSAPSGKSISYCTPEG